MNHSNDPNAPNIEERIKIEHFVSLFHDPKTKYEKNYRLFLFDIQKYSKNRESENSFSIYERNYLLNGEPFTMPPNYDSKKYLCHNYQTIPAKFNQHYFIDQIKCYMQNPCFALAKFHGFTVMDNENHFSPNFFTRRPKLGPLSSLFTKGEFDLEQKYGLICGITYGIKFIHKLNLIHSNLNPTTVYVDEYIHPHICDYVNIPPFNVSILYPIDQKEPNKYVYSFDSKNGKDCFENLLYIAPEIFNDEHFGSSVDVYSLGLVIFFIIEEKEATFNEEGELNYSENFNDEWKKLINRCIEKDLEKRATASDLLDDLLDDSKKSLFLSSISPNSEHSKSSHLYIELIKKRNESNSNQHLMKFNIFHSMVPNINEIDENTKMIIKIAELNDSKCIEKVGDFFLNGQNGMVKDEEFAFYCYQRASNDLNNIDAIIKYAKCFEEGIGVNVDLYEACRKYKTAHDKCLDDQKRAEIKAKSDELTKCIFIKKVPLTLTSQEISSFFNKFELEIEEIPPKEGDKSKQMKLKFKNKDNIKEAKSFLRKFQRTNANSPLKSIEFSAKRKIQNSRFSTLSTILHPIKLDDYYNGEEELIDNYCKGKEKPKDEPNQVVNGYKVLGHGSYAYTYLVFNTKTKQPFAAKVLNNSVESSYINGIKREIIISSKFNHPAIIKYIGFNELSLIDQKSDNLTLIMVYAPNGNLEKVIKNNPELWNNTAKLKAILGIASGFAEIYRYNIIHRDLKPENILINEKLEPLICDFGCSRQFSKNETNNMTSGVGSPIYAGPEIFINNFEMFYTYEIDSYSFGIILYQILTNTQAKLLYDVKNSLHDLTLKKFDNYIPPIPNDMNQVFKELILDCWNISLPERPDPLVIYTKLIEAVKRKVKLLPNVDWTAIDAYLEKINERH